MKLIERTLYLDKLKRVCGTPDIKVVTGVRRSGKSRLMDSYIGWIEESKKDSNIIYIDFTNLKLVLCQEKVQVKSGKFIYSSAHLLV